MFSTPVRVALLLIALLGGAFEVLTGRPTGYLLLTAAALLLYGHFRYGTVWLASRALRAGKLDRAARLLAQVRRPSALEARQRAAFELASGLVATRRHDAAAAEQHLRAALDMKLRTPNNRCLAEVTLAALLAERGETSEARALLSRARERDPTPELREALEQIEATLEPAA